MNVAIVVADGVGAAGVAIAVDVLGAARSIARRLGRALRGRVEVCSHDGRPVRTSSGLRLGGLSTFARATRADVLLVPGTWLETDEDVDAWRCGRDFARLVDVVARARRRGATLGASCTGAYVLGAAGVLDGGPATTSWWLAGGLARACPRVTVDASRALIVRPGLATAGAVFAMADLALHLVRAHAGPEVASLAARYLLLDEHTAQAPYMALAALSVDDDSLRRAEAWLRSNLPTRGSLAQLARAAGASPRTLARRVHAALATTPSRWMRRVRAEEAARLFGTTGLDAETIAERTGFGATASMRRALKDYVGRTPRELRRTPVKVVGSGQSIRDGGSPAIVARSPGPSVRPDHIRASRAAGRGL